MYYYMYSLLVFEASLYSLDFLVSSFLSIPFSTTLLHFPLPKQFQSLLPNPTGHPIGSVNAQDPNPCTNVPNVPHLIVVENHILVLYLRVDLADGFKMDGLVACIDLGGGGNLI